jgi:hypothetical protein
LSTPIAAIRLTMNAPSSAGGKPRCYSITSSARTNSVGGTVGPNALLRSGWERTDRRLSPSSFFAK